MNRDEKFSGARLQTRGATLGSLWRPRPQPVDPHAVRLACMVLVIAYAIVMVVRYDAQHGEFLWIRLAVCLYGVLGVWMARRLTWSRVRAYTVGVAFLLPLSAIYVDGVLGHDLPDLALSALATFAALVFIQAGCDFLLVVVGLALGDAILLWTLPPPVVPMPTVVGVLGAALATGTVAGMTTHIYRTRLNESLAWLQQALGAKGEFLNTMSHELRSPLHVIIGYADMWGEGGGDLDPGYVCERIRASALELLQLVENTMNVARLDAGKITLRVDEFSLTDMVRELAESVRALPEAKTGVPVHWELAPRLPHVRLDRLKLKEIIQNLVSNALKFTREGAVCVTIGRDGDRLRVEVRDTGVGIPEECQARIFDVFERLEAVEGHRPGGVGLGLYIVKSLVHLMKGTIQVASRRGTGSCFTVWMPLRIDAVATPGLEIVSESGAGCSPSGGRPGIDRARAVVLGV